MNRDSGEAGLSAVLKVGFLHGPARAQYGNADRSLNKDTCQSKRKHSSKRVQKRKKKKKKKASAGVRHGLIRGSPALYYYRRPDSTRPYSVDKSKKIHGPLVGHWSMDHPHMGNDKRKHQK